MLPCLATTLLLSNFYGLYAFTRLVFQNWGFGLVDIMVVLYSVFIFIQP